ncbi:MAG: ROK family protein, partial [Bdellovibrionota bacterium]|nr:ROK family protein [Bdellovibrionota bacterium]
CNFHEYCLEGYASGQALQKRWKINSLKKIDDNHPLWEETATFLAKGILNLVYMLSPEKVILGGGVMKREFLFPQIIDKVISLNGSYTVLPKNMVVNPGLNDQSGVIGAMKWASLKKI